MHPTPLCTPLRQWLWRLSRPAASPAHWHCRLAGYAVTLTRRHEARGVVLEGCITGCHDATAIELARCDRPGAPSRLVSVDVQGRFRIDRLQPARYRLVLRNWDGVVPLRSVDLRRMAGAPGR